MQKRGTSSVTIGPAVERLTDPKDELGNQRPPGPSPFPAQLAPKLTLPPPMSPQMLHSPTPVLPPKTTGIPIERLLAAGQAHTEATNPDPAEQNQKPVQHAARADRQPASTRNEEARMLHNTKTALARAQLLAGMYGSGLSADAQDRLASVIIKAALPNIPTAGMSAKPREQVPSRQANTTNIHTSGQNLGSRLFDGAKAIASSPSIIPGQAKGMPPVKSPAVQALTRPASAPLASTAAGAIGASLARPPVGPLAGPLAKPAGLVRLARARLSKQAVLEFVQQAPDKKEALRTIGRLSNALDN